MVHEVRQPCGRKDETVHHDRIKLYVRESRFKDIRTDVNQQRDLLDTTTNVTQKREILSDISTNSEDNPEELPDPVESDSSSNTEALRVLRRSTPKTSPTIFE